MTLRLASLLSSNSLFTGLTALLLAAPSVHAQKPPAMDWVPPAAMGDTLRSDESEQIIPEIIVTSLPKKTADVSAFTNKYTIELEKFGISNDGLHATETSKGINEALQHAKTLGANYIIFPSGTYLISENDPIVLNHKDTIIDLNGATLQIQPNGLPGYATVVTAMGAENMRFTNGTLRGDRDTHDYKTKPGSHEWGAGIRFKSGVNMEIDHITFTDFAGDGVSTETSGHMTRAELLAMIYFSMEKRHLEQGAFSETGEKVPSTEKMRTIVPVDVSKSNGSLRLATPPDTAAFLSLRVAFIRFTSLMRMVAFSKSANACSIGPSTLRRAQSLRILNSISPRFPMSLPTKGQSRAVGWGAWWDSSPLVTFIFTTTSWTAIVVWVWPSPADNAGLLRRIALRTMAEPIPPMVWILKMALS